jgi:DNA-binding GntR family transcriptional regulator
MIYQRRGRGIFVEAKIKMHSAPSLSRRSRRRRRTGAAYSGEIILINHITEVANLPGILAEGGVQSDYPDLNVKMPD